MRATHVLTAGTLCAFFFLSSSALAEQKNCDDVLQKQGAAPYQKCLFDNQEDFIKQQVTAYKNQIEKQKQPIKTYIESQINQEDHSWKDMDLQLEWEESDRKLHISELESAKAAPEEIQREKNALAEIQKIRSLTKTSHSNKVQILKMSKDEALRRLDAAPNEYELGLRKQQMPAL